MSSGAEYAPGTEEEPGPTESAGSRVFRVLPRGCHCILVAVHVSLDKILFSLDRAVLC
jgi:hypothetical protein